MNIALIGQAAFGKAVLGTIVDGGKDEIVGVFAPPDKDGRPPDPLATETASRSLPLFQFPRLRDKEAIAAFKRLEPDLCVMAFVTDIVPMEIIDAPARGTIQYHPSLLPRHRGPSSINWPIIEGETETGLTIFWPDDGLDTGPVLLQKMVKIGPDDTLGKLYFDQLFPMGVEAVAEAVDLVRAGNAPRVPQDETAATYEGWCRARDVVIDWTRPGQEIYNLVRGSDPQPGANTTFGGGKVSFYNASLRESAAADEPGTVVAVDDSGIGVAVDGGVITVGRVRAAGAGKVGAGEYAAGAGLSPGSRFGG